MREKSAELFKGGKLQKVMDVRNVGEGELLEAHTSEKMEGGGNCSREEAAGTNGNTEEAVVPRDATECDTTIGAARSIGILDLAHRKQG